ncbi:PadR family transcriptional regulator [Longispora albida]|uniref:PadR family transcriptional regulator n=1 Tax=Longispora albida TaxID=203523 RepID=UPI00036B1954|nr:PadR family transcriptional regulator [Longispora albida]
MLVLSILGFLAEEPLHGYELRARIHQLSGHARPVSDGSLYPAITRLTEKGLLSRRAEPGSSAAQRQVLELTEAGRAELLRRLREPTDTEISDSTQFFTVLAFLSKLPELADRNAVLRRRLAFLEAGGRGFFHQEQADPYRQGMLTIAKASSKAERAWLRSVLDN